MSTPTNNTNVTNAVSNEVIIFSSSNILSLSTYYGIQITPTLSSIQYDPLQFDGTWKIGSNIIYTSGNLTADTLGAAPASHVGSGGSAHALATTSTDGFMSAADKTKVNNMVISSTTINGYALTANITLHASDVNAAPTLLTLNTQTVSNYTLSLTDANACIEMNNANSNTVTIPLNSSVPLPIGTTILVRMMGAGQTSLAAASGVTVLNPHGTLKLSKQYASTSLHKRDTDTWCIEGNMAES